jgi:hypothetical protein
MSEKNEAPKKIKLNEAFDMGGLEATVVGYNITEQISSKAVLFGNILSLRYPAYMSIEMKFKNKTTEDIVLYKNFFNLFDRRDFDHKFPFRSPQAYTYKMKVKKDNWMWANRIAPGSEVTLSYVVIVPSHENKRYSGTRIYKLVMFNNKSSNHATTITFNTNKKRKKRP